MSYLDNITSISADELIGFFVGWPNPPTPKKHLDILKNSSHVILAKDDETGKIIGFINAISDKAISAYIPLLEVLPEYQGNNIGKELVQRMLNKLKDYYMVDLCCDEKLSTFYDKFGMTKTTGMILRNYEKLN
ncbi:MAG: GNAT family N-acetyltransferase [Bacteroidia bacterium]|nr:GNAT family N-acetyltransferase [Bacteroidia bacterium]